MQLNNGNAGSKATCDSHVVGYLAVVASCLENLCHGLIMGSAFALSGKVNSCGEEIRLLTRFCGLGWAVHDDWHSGA